MTGPGTDDIKVRAFREADIPLVMDSWMETYRSAPDVRLVPNEVYFPTQRRVIRALMARCRLAVACDPNDEDQVYGWVAWEERERDVVIHYTYTKGIFRRMGVARRLWQVANPSGKDVVATHLGPSSWELKQAGKRFWFRPFLLLTAVCTEGNEQ